VPGWVNVKLHDCPWASIGERNVPPATSCDAWSWFVHVTTSPTRTVIDAGMYAYCAIGIGCVSAADAVLTAKVSTASAARTTPARPRIISRPPG
jgi:hypothetical protein